MKDLFNQMPFERAPLETGVVLLSEPFLTDPHFKRSVILLTDYSNESATGFVMNQPANILMSDVIEGVSLGNHQLYIGGPVGNDELFYIHQITGIPNALEIAPNLFWGGDFNPLIHRILDDGLGEKDIRFISGYSGWGPEQLLEETKTRSWITCKPIYSRLFEKPELMWEKLVGDLGKPYEVMTNFPEDPSLN